MLRKKNIKFLYFIKNINFFKKLGESNGFASYSLGSPTNRISLFHIRYLLKKRNKILSSFIMFLK